MERVEAPWGLKMLVFGGVQAADCVCQFSPHTGSLDGLSVIKWLSGDTEEMEEG